MTRLTLLLLATTLLLLPASTTAQTTNPETATERLSITLPSVAAAMRDEDASLLPSGPPAQAQRRRRRPSMVGYISDGTIRSQIRVRFDGGWEITSPDRAEFFYAKCGCYAGLPSSHPGFDPNAPGPGPGIAGDVDFQQLEVHAEYAVQERFSLFTQLPLRWLRPQPFGPTGDPGISDETGLSDIRAGAKWAVAASDDQFLTVQLQASAPSGRAAKGLGTDHWSVEPALLYFQRLAERVTLESQFGAVLPVGGAAGIPTSGDEDFAGKVLYYGIGPSFELYSSDRVRFGPVIELVGWRVLSGFQTAPEPSEADGINIVNLKVGGRFVFQDQDSVYIGYGRALTDRTWYDKILRVEYRRSFQ